MQGILLHGEDREVTGRRVQKNDVIFLSVLFLLVLAAAGFFFLLPRQAGARVEVTVNGEVYGIYELDTEQEIPIVSEGRTTNLLVISQGRADMTEADCPDKLCVHQRAISKNNETIVCLPNRVVVRVTGSEESGLDSVAK